MTYCGQQTFTSRSQSWWVGKAKQLWIEPAVVKINPLQGNSSPLIRVLPFLLCLCSQAPWESSSHLTSSLVRLIILPAVYCSPKPMKVSGPSHICSSRCKERAPIFISMRLLEYQRLVMTCLSSMPTSHCSSYLSIFHSLAPIGLWPYHHTKCI